MCVSYIMATDFPVDGGYLAMGPEGLGEKSTFAGTATNCVCACMRVWCACVCVVCVCVYTCLRVCVC